MAEVIAVLGIAANIVQFLDFGTNFVSKAWRICSAGRDGLCDISDLESTTFDLQKILQSLQTPVEDNGESIDGQTGLRQFADQCQVLATELLNSIQKISASGKTRKRDALTTAFRFVWKEKEIRHLEARLEGFRHQLAFHILALLR